MTDGDTRSVISRVAAPTNWPVVPTGYAWLRTRFRAQETAYDELRRDLMKAHMAVTYDDYLARSAVYSVGVGLLGVAIGGVLVSLAGAAGLAGAITSPVSLGPLGQVLSAYKVVALTAVGASLGGTLLGYGTWQVLLRRPASRAASRKREINVTLPHAIVFLYALTYGGMNVIEAMRALANAGDAYGEVSREFDRIVTDMEYFGTDMPTALRNAREATPSKAFEQFLDDTLTVTDTGGNLSAFFGSESERYLEQARNEQEDLIEFLSLIAEMYITLLVAGPLFLIILLLVIGLLGGATIGQVYVIIYAAIPLLSMAVLVLLDTVAAPFTRTTWRMDIGTTTGSGDDNGPEGEPETGQAGTAPEDEFTAYSRRKRRIRLLRRLRNPGQLLRHRPALSGLVTIPVAVSLAAGLDAVGLIDVSADGFLTAPVGTTTGAVVLPFFVVAVPYVLLYEKNRRRTRRIEQRFPDILSMISNANEIGLTLAESFRLVATRDHSQIAPELRKVHNDIEWNGDVGHAMVRLANRLRVPIVSRTMRLLVESNRSSSDLHRILAVAAEDASSHERLTQERASEVSAYVAVVIITFLVFLGIIAMLDVFFLDTFAAQAAQAPAPGDMATPSSFGGLAVEEFRMAFFHASLVQALFGGLLAGKMAHNRTASGLKYSIALITLALVVFLAL